MRVDRQKLKKTILEVLSEAQQPTGAQAAMTPSAADPSTGKVDKSKLAQQIRQGASKSQRAAEAARLAPLEAQAKALLQDINNVMNNVGNQANQRVIQLLGRIKQHMEQQAQPGQQQQQAQVAQQQQAK